MPPHCDALDGPVVLAAMEALRRGDVFVILPFVDETGEQEVRDAFSTTMQAREGGGIATDVAERWFFETVVRLHRRAEGAPYTGLKPAGLDHGPVIPVAERAIATGSPQELIDLLVDLVADEAKRRFEYVMELRAHADDDLTHARKYTHEMLGFQVWSNTLATAAHTNPHESHGEYERHER
jgi:hypothetical protein